MSHPIIPTITVQQLLDDLKDIPGETELSFSGLTYKRPKWRGPTRLDLEFEENVYRNTRGVLVLEAREPGR
jgi:hypothetical protein